MDSLSKIKNIKNFKKETLIKEIYDKFGNELNNDNFSKIFTKKHKLNIENLLDENNLKFIKENLDKEIVILKDDSIDSTTATANLNNLIRDQLLDKKVNIINNQNNVGDSYSKIKDQLQIKDNEFKNYFFISVGKTLDNYNKIKDITSNGGKVLAIDNTRIGNDFIPTNDIEYFKEKQKDNLVIANPHLSDYGNEDVSITNMANKIFLSALDKENMPEINKSLTTKNKILNGLSIIGNLSDLNNFENNIVAQEMLSSLNNMTESSAKRKIQILKEALKIDEFDIENVHHKLLGFIFNVNKYYQNMSEDDRADSIDQWRNFTEVLDFIFEDKINENEFKSILRTVMYIQDKDKMEFSEQYSEFQEFMNINFSDDNSNVFADFDKETGKLTINGKKFPLEGESQFDNKLTYSEAKSLLNKYKGENYKNVFLSSVNGNDVFIDGMLHEKLKKVFKSYITKNKGDISKIGGEDYNYSFIIDKERAGNFIEHIEKNTKNNMDLKELNSIKLENFDLLDAETLKIVKRDLGIINPGKITYSLKDASLYNLKQDLDRFYIEVRDKNKVKKKVFVNEYFFKYIKENYEIGDDLSLYLKASIIVKANGELEVGFNSPGIIKESTLNFQEMKKNVDESLGELKSNFNLMLKIFDEKGSYEVMHNLIHVNKKTPKEALIECHLKLTELNNIADNNNGLKELNIVKDKINKFTINKDDYGLDYLLDLEKERLTFGGSHIIPFLIKDGNQSFIVNNNDRFIYNNTLDRRNKLFYQGEEIFNWFNDNIGKISDNSNKESMAYLNNIKNNIRKKIANNKSDSRTYKQQYKKEEISKETLDKQVSDDLIDTLDLIKKHNEIKSIISELRSLRTSFKNQIHSRYMELNSLKFKNKLNFSDIVLDKSSIRNIYFNDKINNKQFYNNFYNFDHFFQTAKLSVGTNKKLFKKEIITFLNSNNYNSSFDSLIYNLGTGDLNKNILDKEFYNGLSIDSKNKFMRLIEKNLTEFQKVFNISLLETDNDKIKYEIFSNFGIGIKESIKLDNKIQSNDRINDLLDKKNIIIDEIKYIIKSGKNKKQRVSGGKRERIPFERNVTDYLNNGDVNGERIENVIKNGLDLTKYMDNGFLVLAYLRDLGLKGKGKGSYGRKDEFLGDRSKATVLNNDLLFLKNDEFDFFFKILGDKKIEWKDTLFTAHEREILKVGGSGKIDSNENRNRGIVDYYKNIFNIYKLDVPFISNQLIGSGFINHMFDNIRNLYNNDIKNEYNKYLINNTDKNNKLTIQEFLENKIKDIGIIHNNGTYEPKRNTIFNPKIGVKNFLYHTMLLEYFKYNENYNFEIDKFRRFISTQMGKHIKQNVNNFQTSQSESYFIFNIQRKLGSGLTVDKPSLDYSYKDIIKETFGLLDDIQKEKIYNILSKTNSNGKNLLPDFIIRNSVGNIIGIGEIYGGNSNDTENYEETKKIKNDILAILKESGINTFTVNYDVKDKMKPIDKYLLNMDRNINKSKKIKDKSIKEYNDYISKNGLEDIIEGVNYKIDKNNIEKFKPLPLNKLNISDINKEKENGRLLIFFDTETTGFGRKGNPLSYNGGSIFQLAYSNLKGEYISEEFKEIKGPLIKKIEDLTHWKRSEILKIGKDPKIGMTNLLFEIVGKDLKERALDKNKKMNIRSFASKRHKFGILVGHNSFAFDAPMVGNMIKYIFTNKENQKWLNENPNIKAMYSYFIKYGFDMGDTLNYSREILNEDKNYFLGKFDLKNKNNKLGPLYKLSQIKKAEMEGKDINLFKKELKNKIKKNAHNAQFDIEMTKEVYEYIESVYNFGKSELTNNTSNLLNNILKNNHNIKDHYLNFRTSLKGIKEEKDNIDYYNKIIKLLVLQLGKTDLKIELNDNGKYSLHRVSEFKKYNLDKNKLENSLSELGLSSNEINDMGIFKEKITKENAKLLTGIVKNLAEKDEKIDIYEITGERLHLNFNIKKTEYNGRGEKMHNKLKKELLNLSEENLIKYLNEIVDVKEMSYKAYKKNSVNLKRETLITEQLMKSIFSLNNTQFKLLENLFNLNSVFINNKNKKLNFYGKEDFTENKNAVSKFSDKGIELIYNDKYKLMEIKDIKQFDKNEGGKILNENKNFYKIQVGKKILLGIKGESMGTYGLNKQTEVNIDKIKKLISLNYVSNVDSELLTEMIEAIVDKRVNNKAIRENFNNSRELFENLTKHSVHILRSANYIRE